MFDDPHSAIMLTRRQLAPDALQRLIAYCETVGAYALANAIRGGVDTEEGLPFEPTAAELSRLGEPT